MAGRRAPESRKAKFADFKDEEALELGETRRSQVQILPAVLPTR